MRYDLKSVNLNKTFYIQCPLAEKPQTLGNLIDGIAAGTITWQPDFEDKMGDLALEILGKADVDLSEELDTDFETCKPIRHNINWPRTEDLR